MKQIIFPITISKRVRWPGSEKTFEVMNVWSMGKKKTVIRFGRYQINFGFTKK